MTTENEIKRILPEDRPGFRSYAKAVWTDLNNTVHRRYVVQPSSAGFKIVDTCNNANSLIQDFFATQHDAEEWLRKIQAP